jgi:hypothetical protein
VVSHYKYLYYLISIPIVELSIHFIIMIFFEQILWGYFFFFVGSSCVYAFMVWNNLEASGLLYPFLKIYVWVFGGGGGGGGSGSGGPCRGGLVLVGAKTRL